MSFQEAYRSKNHTYLASFEKTLQQEMDRYKSSRLYKPLVYALQGGGRIRPLIVLLSAQASEGSWKEALGAAVAVELLHTESIIHDDIIDEEASRRGKTAFHIKYGYGSSMLTADFVFGIILDIVARYADQRVAKEISSAALRMCEGELEELKTDPAVHKMTWDEYLKLISLKTASLFETAARVGAVFGKEACLEDLSRFGFLLGMAYQMQDDARDWAQRSETSQVVYLGKRNDASSYLMKMCRSYSQQAKKALKALPSSEAKSNLEELASLTVERAEGKVT